MSTEKSKTTVSVSPWTELHDPKEGRKLREIPCPGKCDDCGKWNGHALDCKNVTLENLAVLLQTAQRNEACARERSVRYWEMLQRAAGKLYVLRHENNKLRKANEKLKRDPQ